VKYCSYNNSELHQKKDNKGAEEAACWLVTIAMNIIKMKGGLAEPPSPAYAMRILEVTLNNCLWL